MVTRADGSTNAAQALCDGGVAMIDHGPVLDISSTTNDKWVSRATVDIRMRAMAVQREVVSEYFESVSIDGKCGDEQQSFTVP